MITTFPPTRLDRYLRKTYPGLTQGTIEKFLRTKKILVNNQAATSSTRIESSEQVNILADLSIYQELDTQPTPVKISNEDKIWIQSLIIWEDDELIAINKPQGIAVQGGTGIKKHVDGLMRAYNPEARLVHRIDKDTSGVLVMAKTIRMAQYLTQLFKEHGVHKTYRAIVEGSVSLAQGIIDLPLGKEDVGGGKEKMVVGGPKAKPAETQYMLRKKLGNKYSVVDCWPKSGRTHQLRVHLSASGWPIVGDYKYGAIEKGHTLHLHAFKIEFPHYDSGRIVLTAPMSLHMENTVRKFGADPDKL
jgi:23S rRNA pseudouridine955/2504/2580 synthase